MMECQESFIVSSYFAPRGHKRMYALGMQLAQQYLSPFDKLIGSSGDSGAGKSALIRGMFPNLELTNDDNGLYIRPLPLLDVDQDRGFFSPHSYHVDIRFETGFTQPHVLAEAIMEALRQGKRVVVEHFDLIYPLLPRNADLMIGVGEQILVNRPTIFGPEPDEFVKTVHSSLPYRLMAHTAEDLCEMHMEPVLVNSCKHDDIRHGFVLAFQEMPPMMDLVELERRVNEDIAADLPVHYHDENHIAVGERLHECSGPRTHVSTTGKIKGFRLHHELVYDNQMQRYLLIGFVGEDSAENLEKLKNRKQFFF